MTKVMTCNCVNVQQDNIHGAGKRVFNRTAKKIGERFAYRCTVCSTDRTPGESIDPKKTKKK
jgi:hypothetical protein